MVGHLSLPESDSIPLSPPVEPKGLPWQPFSFADRRHNASIAKAFAMLRAVRLVLRRDPRRQMKASAFDEAAFFQAIAACPARALLIGRRGLIALGMPVMTRDYDFWLPADDAAAFNAALRPFDMLPSRSPEDARANGRYVSARPSPSDVARGGCGEWRA
jgi:hypothetical protein